MTFYVPKKWLDKKGLKPGDEINVTEDNNKLIIEPEKTKKQKKTINIEIKESRESSIRTLIVIAYRAGFDQISIKYTGKEKDINQIVNNFLIGFDVTKTNKDEYIIESISEPSYDNFENIIQRQFYLLELIIQKIGDTEIEQYVHKVQKYDNFLKRCLSKEIFNTNTKPFLWQFLSNLTQISRACFHFHKDITNKKNKKIKNLIKRLEEMINILKISYLKRDTSQLHKLHNMEQEIVRNERKKLNNNKDALYLHHIYIIARVIYLANSPLTGVLQLRSFKSS